MKTTAQKSWMARITLLLAVGVGVPGAPAAPPPTGGDEPDEYAAPRVSDPLEPVNRAVFKFNDGFYQYALRPFSQGYERVVPAPVRHSLGNFFDNLKFPVRLVSSVFQAKPGRALKETGKFLLNSTVGLAGLARVSDSFPTLTAVPPEDVGQTLGVWGLGAGPYLVWPLLGPSSLRDTVGLAGNIMVNPFYWSKTQRQVLGDDATLRYGVLVLEFANASPDQIRTYDAFKQSAVDPYVAVRNGYLQYRAAAVKK